MACSEPTSTGLRNSISALCPNKRFIDLRRVTEAWARPEKQEHHPVIIRRFASSQQLITQPEHSALAARIMRQWQEDHFPESPRKASILHAIEQHDCGWAEVDEALLVDETTGQLLDFLEVSDAVKRDTSSRGIERLSLDPYAAALVTEHRLHVYGRYADYPEWRAFMADLTAARDAYLRAAGDT